MTHEPMTLPKIITDTAPIVPVSTAAFDYSTMPDDQRDRQQERASRIGSLMRRSVEAMGEIGRELLTARSELEHGQFLSWVERGLGLSKSTAYRFMDMAEHLGSDLPSVGTLPLVVVHKLAERSTPQPVRAALLSRIKAGESIGADEILQEVRGAKEAAKRALAQEKEVSRRAKLTPEERASEDNKAKRAQKAREVKAQEEEETRRAEEVRQEKRRREINAGAEVLISCLGLEGAASFAARFGSYGGDIVQETGRLAGIRRSEGEAVVDIPVSAIGRVGQLSHYMAGAETRAQVRALAEEITATREVPVGIVAKVESMQREHYTLLSDPIAFRALVDTLNYSTIPVRIVPPLKAANDVADPVPAEGPRRKPKSGIDTAATGAVA